MVQYVVIYIVDTFVKAIIKLDGINRKIKHFVGC